MADYTGDVIRLLRQHGCTFVRHGKGDHDRWYSPISKKNITVDSAIKDRNLANAVLKQAGINQKL